MSEVVDKMAAAGHLTAEQVERIGERVHEFLKEAKSNPALLKEASEKLGTFWEHFGKALPVAAASAAAGGLLGAGSMIGSRMYEDVKHGVMKSKRYKNMMDENPHLKQFSAKATQKAFDTLHRFNPEYAADPNVAGTFVRNTVEQDRTDIQSINSLVQGRSNLAQSRQNERVFKPSDMMRAVPSSFREEEVPGAAEVGKKLGIS